MSINSNFQFKIGPVLKISFPKFGFDEALREEKRLESYFE